MLCNDYRHASAPARSESWGVDDVQVDFTGLAIIRPHRSSPDRVVRQCTPKVSGALTSLDPKWGRSIRALAMRSLSNSSKPRTFCGRVGLGLAGHGCLAPGSVLEHEKKKRKKGIYHHFSLSLG